MKKTQRWVPEHSLGFTSTSNGEKKTSNFLFKYEYFRKNVSCMWAGGERGREDWKEIMMNETVTERYVRSPEKTPSYDLLHRAGAATKVLSIEPKLRSFRDLSISSCCPMAARILILEPTVYGLGEKTVHLTWPQTVASSIDPLDSIYYRIRWETWRERARPFCVSPFSLRPLRRIQIPELAGRNTGAMMQSRLPTKKRSSSRFARRAKQSSFYRT